MEHAALIVLGLVAGVLSGLLGIGGGLVIVPVLNQLFRVPIQIAVGTSLLIIIPTAVVGTLTHVTRGNVDPKVGLWVVVGAMLGGFLGARAADVLPELALKRVFAVLLVFVAFRMFFNR